MSEQKRGRKRDWKSYSQALVRTEEVSCLYISVDTMVNDHSELASMNRGKLGRAFTYSDSIMFPLALLHTVLYLPYRQLEGLLRSRARIILELVGCSGFLETVQKDKEWPSGDREDT